MTAMIIQDLVFLVVLLALAWPLGRYITRALDGERTFLSPVLEPVEKVLYRLMGIDPGRDMSARRYGFSVLSFSLVGLVVVFGLQMLQGVLPGNPQGLAAPRWDLALNTAVSYITNTNWQGYAGESTLSYLTQALGLTVQNFVSAATGIAVLFALIRGFIRREATGLGNFWADLTRITLYILLPLSLILAILLMSQGVVQTLIGSQAATTLQDGGTQWLPLGPAASQISIKQLGTNGGGFFGANSAFPFENPTAFSNIIETLALLIIPAALCFTFGRAVKNMKQGRTFLIVMGLLFIVALVVITCSEQFLGPDFAGVISGGNMEGKETVNGVGATALWGASTTSASNGAVNGMLDSFTALGGMMLMFLMQLGEIIFGGVGSGLYGMVAFVMLTVFIAGLMVGRTPEYLGKKIEPYDMKMVCLVILAPPLLTLLGTAAAVMMPGASSWVGNSGAHGFSEILYAFTSMGNNNGSAFAGFDGNTYFTNIVGAVVMLGARFIPMLAVILLAGHLGGKKAVATSEGTLSTTNGLFVGLLTGIIVIIGALSFLPALALGPIADFVTGR